MKRVCADLYNEERIRQEKIKESENDGMLSAKQAMDMLGVKAETLWRWHNRGYLCHVKVGNRNYYKRCDLEEILRKKDVIRSVFRRKIAGGSCFCGHGCDKM